MATLQEHQGQTHRVEIGVLESFCVSPINIYIYSLHLFAILSPPLSYLRMSLDSFRGSG